MTEDIFDSISKLEKQADEIVEHAKERAREFRREVDVKLKALADELEKDYGLERGKIEAVVAAKREKLFAEFGQRLRDGMARLAAARQEKMAPLVRRIVEAFRESTTNVD